MLMPRNKSFLSGCFVDYKYCHTLTEFSTFSFSFCYKIIRKPVNVIESYQFELNAIDLSFLSGKTVPV